MKRPISVYLMTNIDVPSQLSSMLLCFLCSIEDKNNFMDEPVRTNLRIPLHVFLSTEVYILVDHPKLPCILEIPREGDAFTLDDIETFLSFLSSAGHNVQ